jgi:hypothetical protein
MAWNRVSRYMTEVINDAAVGELAVIYRRTTIVSRYNSGDSGAPTIILRTGGWKSVTTKRKMNQAAVEFSLPFQVWQHKHEWWVRTNAGEFPFNEDTIAFDAITGEPVVTRTMPERFA